jgi:hypothetical protein
MVYLCQGVKVLRFMHPRLCQKRNLNHVYSGILWRTLSLCLPNLVQLTVRAIVHGLPLSGSESACTYTS